MGKIKYGNLYDKNGNLIKKAGNDGKIKYNIKEVEKLLDDLYEDKDENGKIKNPKALDNVNAVLMQMYKKYGNPNKEELINKLKAFNKEYIEKKAKEALKQENVIKVDGKQYTYNEDDLNAIQEKKKSALKAFSKKHIDDKQNIVNMPDAVDSPLNAKDNVTTIMDEYIDYEEPVVTQK